MSTRAGCAAAALAAAALLAPAGCGPKGKPKTVPADDTPLCRPLSSRVIGHVTDPAADELSGLVASRTQAGVLWTHNDSGDSARVIATRLDGRSLGSFPVTGAEAEDWEDIATGPAPGANRAYLYAGDIGDNFQRRATVAVYRFPEPDVRNGPRPTASATTLTLRYPDGSHDAEALLVDPLSGDLAIVTKQFNGNAGVYVTRAASLRPGPAITLDRVARIDLGFGRTVTAGDVSSGGGTVALRSYDRIFVWRRSARDSLAQTLGSKPCASPTVLDEDQGEALALVDGGQAALTVTEGSGPPLRRYAPAAPS
jgi:hypothetical protein